MADQLLMNPLESLKIGYAGELGVNPYIPGSSAGRVPSLYGEYKSPASGYSQVQGLPTNYAQSLYDIGETAPDISPVGGLGLLSDLSKSPMPDSTRPLGNNQVSSLLYGGTPRQEDTGGIMPQDWSLGKSPQNTAQAGKAASKSQQQSYDEALKAATTAWQGAKERTSALEGLKGFTPEQGRRYSTEKDAAGNIIAVHALQTAGEALLGGRAPGELEKKSWTAQQATGTSGPFTPNLDKFKARQTPEALMHSWDASKPIDQAKQAQEIQERRAGAGLTAGSTPEQVAQNRAILKGMADKRMGRSTVGQVVGADVTSSDGWDRTTTHYTPQTPTSSQANVAQSAIQQNKEIADQGHEPAPGEAGFGKQLQQVFSNQASPAFQKKWDAALKKDIEATKKKNQGGIV